MRITVYLPNGGSMKVSREKYLGDVMVRNFVKSMVVSEHGLDKRIACIQLVNDLLGFINNSLDKIIKEKG